MSRSPITCHVLDARQGRPGQNVGVRLEKFDSDQASFTQLAEGTTDSDGRCTSLLSPATKLDKGIYKMTFKTGEYFAASNVETFYPVVEITFQLKSPDEHYHVPLLLSPWSYTTYRGS
ncbi:hypothetical protein BOTBODRAFT_31619 [Botryobasidium botryosum FD-172 SS1]|uniref:5-hydroxyisourate hydrolase n=1 Tax=Botryobasidium botryosum (strain FD-172 SS1) TaxID=930990 RepID=A0A067MLX5_BOTB1|nr:hypothetical protein BOTBODRAFT_31619 [Botryobasidium botryosum FD-172 SS1]